MQRIDAIFAAEREVNRQSVERRRAACQERIVPFVAGLKVFDASRPFAAAEAQPYCTRDGLHAQTLTCIDQVPRQRTDLPYEQRGRACAAQHRVRPQAWPFASSDRGGERAAVICGLVITAWLNAVDPQA